MIFSIKGAPIAKKRPRFARRGRYVTTYSDQEQVEKQVKIILKQQMQGEKLTGPLHVSMCFYRAIPASWSKKKHAQALSCEIIPTGRPDLDNYIKFYLDCMNGLVYQDDSAIVCIEAMQAYSSEPRTVIDVGSVAFKKQPLQSSMSKKMICQVCKQESDCKIQLSEHGKETVCVCSFDCGIKCLNDKKLIEKIRKSLEKTGDN